jgi:hypothetical protein
LIQLLLIFLALLAVFVVRRVLATGSPDLQRKFRRGLFWFGIFLLALFAARGYLVWLVPLLGALLAMLIRMLPMLLPVLLRYGPQWQRQQRTASRPGTGGGADTSSVESRYLRMRLNHATGEIAGEVLAGRYAGRMLRDLSLDQLSELYEECARNDAESAALLQAYLERLYGTDWETHREARSENPASGKMDTREAYQVLGLQPGASRESIVGAHRRLMQKLHPDRGGSDYLAAKINQAKDILLGR